LVVSENFAKRWNIGIGDSVRLESPAGTIELPVVGALEDYHSDRGSVFIDRSLYKAHWNDSSADYVFIKLKPGADSMAVRSAIQSLVSGGQQAFIYTNEEYKRWITRLIDRFFVLYHIQTVIAILVAAIGIINTLTISVAERRRELGVIRAVGGLRSQTRKMVLLEAVALALVGVVAGATSSVFNTYFLVKTAATIISGSSLPFRFPLDIIVASVPLAALLAIAAAWWPARQAVRLKVVEAIGYE
jgi:putative ABC transport system permease protein